jgi:hypothetical protein
VIKKRDNIGFSTTNDSDRLFLSSPYHLPNNHIILFYNGTSFNDEQVSPHWLMREERGLENQMQSIWRESKRKRKLKIKCFSSLSRTSFLRSPLFSLDLNGGQVVIVLLVSKYLLLRNFSLRRVIRVRFMTRSFLL